MCQLIRTDSYRFLLEQPFYRLGRAGTAETGKSLKRLELVGMARARNCLAIVPPAPPRPRKIFTKIVYTHFSDPLGIIFSYPWVLKFSTLYFFIFRKLGIN